MIIKKEVVDSPGYANWFSENKGYKRKIPSKKHTTLLGRVEIDAQETKQKKVEWELISIFFIRKHYMIYTSTLNWEMAPKLDSGMIYGVEILPLKKPFQFHLILLAQRKLLWLLNSNFLEVPFSGM